MTLFVSDSNFVSCLFIFCHLSLFFSKLFVGSFEDVVMKQRAIPSFFDLFSRDEIQSHLEMYSLSTVYLLKLRKKPPFYISVQVVV